jgi:hypothetical protein
MAIKYQSRPSKSTLNTNVYDVFIRTHDAVFVYWASKQMPDSNSEVILRSFPSVGFVIGLLT